MGHRVRLHGRDVPHRDQEPGRGDLLPGGQARGHHQHAPRLAQGTVCQYTTYRRVLEQEGGLMNYTKRTNTVRVAGATPFDHPPC